MGIAKKVIEDLLEAHPFTSPTRVDFGAGTHPQKCVRESPLTDIDRDVAGGEYINVDLYYNGDEDYLIRELWQTSLLPDRFDVVYSSHALQCVAPHGIAATLRHWKVLLKPGGLLWLSVPNIRWLARQLADAPTNLGGEWIERIYAARENGNHTGFTAWTLTHALYQAGFADIVVTETDVVECHGMSELRAVAHKPTKTLAETAHDAFQSVGLALA